MENLLNTANNAMRTSVEQQSKKNGQATQHLGGDGGDEDSSCKIIPTTNNESEVQLINNKQTLHRLYHGGDPLTLTTTPQLSLTFDHGPPSLPPKNHHNNTNGINNNNNNNDDDNDDTTTSVLSTTTTTTPNASTALPPPQQQPQKSPELILGVGELTGGGPPGGGNNSSSLINTINSVNNNNHIIINNPDYINSTTTTTNNHVAKNNNSNNNSKWMKAKRNVTFPEDNSIVTGFTHPCNPWKNAPICTAEELVIAYKKGCELNGVKPWNKIIQQLLSIQNCWDRHKTLNLKGEKLDGKHCEALEDIFRRVQFETLELEACHLDDETAAALFDMIEYYDSTMKLNMSFNKNIGIRGWQSCSRMIRKTPSLSHLDARGCELNDHIIPVLGRSLKMGSNLTVLHLEYTYLSGRPLVILVAALKVNEVLQELFLGDNKLMASDGIQIGNLLKFNHKLQLLDLRNNHFQDVGLSHICDGLCEKVDNYGLSTLVLWNNQISYQGMPSLSRALSVVECLETLNLGHNSITNEGIHYLKEGLLKNKSLIRLGLQGTKVLCEGAVALAEYIADSSRLLRIDLRENDVRTAGLMALSLALKVNESLVRLELDRNTKKEVKAVKDYADQQRRLLHDINNYLERNQGLAIKRENEEKEKERRKAQEAAKKQEDEKLAKEQEQEVEDLESVYIPTCTKIRRPTLLFPCVLSPQRTLDSPAFIPDSEFINQLNSQLCSPVSPMTHMTPSPPGEFLLSPQYCENIKARKIFTVTKVGEMGFQRSPTSGSSLPSPGGGLMSPTSSMDQIILSFGSDQTSSSGKANSCPLNGPHEIRKEIAAETVCGLFGILRETETEPETEAIQTANMPDCKSLNNEKSVNENQKQPDSERPNNTNTENKNEVELGGSVTNKDNSSLKYEEEEEEEETFLSELESDNEDSSKEVVSTSSPPPSNDCSQVNNCNDIENLVESPIESVVAHNDNNITRNEDLAATDLDRNGDIEFVNTRNVDNCKKDFDNVTGKSGSEMAEEAGGSFVGSFVDEDVAAGSLFTKCDKKEFDDSAAHDTSAAADTQDEESLEINFPKTCEKSALADDEVSSGSELTDDCNGCIVPQVPASCHLDKLGEKCRPEFHSNLSLNGMTQELANVLDSLELEANCKAEILPHTFKTIQTDTVTSPAEYEKELDDMLAHVQQGYNVK